ncbi:MAG: hypothetical protein ABI934_12660, partial [Actinomycetota bacterium]
MRLSSVLSQIAVLGLFSGAVVIGMPSAPVSLSTTPRPVAPRETTANLLAPGQVPEARALADSDRKGAVAQIREAAAGRAREATRTAADAAGAVKARSSRATDTSKAAGASNAAAAPTVSAPTVSAPTVS